MALTREVCALKLVESQLLSAIAAANGNADAAQSRIYTLQDEIVQMKRTASSTAPAVSASLVDMLDNFRSSADLRTALASRDSDLFALRSRLTEVQQEADGRALKAQQLADDLEAARRDTAHEREVASAAQSNLKEQMTAEAVRERGVLVAEAERARAKVAELTHQLQEQVRCR